MSIINQIYTQYTNENIEKIVELELTAEEKELFAKSAAAVHKTNEALKEVGAL